jgi:hypothetical protein
MEISGGNVQARAVGFYYAPQQSARLNAICVSKGRSRRLPTARED